ncbi:MAG: type II secretion system protein [Candidatus Omnitrophica bacterium]|nr:type II secretion system protein [Candidatus Omnitrophota bacterium]
MISLSRRKGFTLIEIMVVVIILGVIASLALSNYHNIGEQNRCRAAQMNLLRIYNASKVREVKDTTHIHVTGAEDINLVLKIKIDDPNFIYTYRYYDSLSWLASATRVNGPPYGCMLAVNSDEEITSIICPSDYCGTSIIP